MPMVVGCVEASVPICTLIVALCTRMENLPAAIENMMDIYRAIIGILNIFHVSLEYLIESLERFVLYLQNDDYGNFRTIVERLQRYAAQIAAALAAVGN